MKVGVGVNEDVVVMVAVGVRVRVLVTVRDGVDVLVAGLCVFVEVGKGALSGE